MHTTRSSRDETPRKMRNAQPPPGGDRARSAPRQHAPAASPALLAPRLTASIASNSSSPALPARRASSMRHFSRTCDPKGPLQDQRSPGADAGAGGRGRESNGAGAAPAEAGVREGGAHEASAPPPCCRAQRVSEPRDGQPLNWHATTGKPGVAAAACRRRRRTWCTWSPGRRPRRRRG